MSRSPAGYSAGASVEDAGDPDGTVEHDSAATIQRPQKKNLKEFLKNHSSSSLDRPIPVLTRRADGMCVAGLVDRSALPTGSSVPAVAEHSGTGESPPTRREQH